VAGFRGDFGRVVGVFSGEGSFASGTGDSGVGFDFYAVGGFGVDGDYPGDGDYGSGVADGTGGGAGVIFVLCDSHGDGGDRGGGDGGDGAVGGVCDVTVGVQSGEEYGGGAGGVGGGGVCDGVSGAGVRFSVGVAAGAQWMVDRGRGDGDEVV